MANLRKLDDARRLTPWSIPQHAAYVRGEYARLCAASPAKGKQYLVDYRRKEDEALGAHEEQMEQQKRSAEMLNQRFSPSDLSHLEWDPETSTPPDDQGAGNTPPPPPPPPDPVKARKKELEAMRVDDGIDPLLVTLGLPVEGNKQVKIDAILAKEFPTPPSA